MVRGRGGSTVDYQTQSYTTIHCRTWHRQSGSVPVTNLYVFAATYFDILSKPSTICPGDVKNNISRRRKNNVFEI